MNDTPSKEDACTETAEHYASAERSLDRAIKEACDLMSSIIKSQKACGKDPDPIDSNKVTPLKTPLGEAQCLLTQARAKLTESHDAANVFCDDGGIIVTGGGK